MNITRYGGGMQLNNRTDLLFSPYVRISNDVEDTVEMLKMAFLTFDKDNDTSEDMVRLVEELYAKTFFNLSSNSKKERSRDDYLKLVNKFKDEARAYQEGRIQFPLFDSRLFEYYMQFIYMKSLAGFRINRKEKRNPNEELAADLKNYSSSELQDDSDYDESADAEPPKES